MSFRLICVAVDPGDADRIADLLEQCDPRSTWRSPAGQAEEQEQEQIFAVVHVTAVQEVMDRIAGALEDRDGWRLMAQSLEAVLPEAESDEELETVAARNATAAREEIFTQISEDAVLTPDFLILVGIATFVAAIGLSNDNIPVVIGSMVIAPLLGPILAFAFGTALGNRQLLVSSVRSLSAGLGVAVATGLLLGLIVPSDMESPLLNYSRQLGIEELALPVASGAAAGLMVARGRVSALVGVMVAAALLPPLSAFGLLIGHGSWAQGLRALAVVGINIVAITLSAQLVLLAKGVRPRRYLSDRHRNSIRINIAVCAGLLASAAAAVLYF